MKQLLTLCVSALLVLGAIAAGCSSESGKAAQVTFTFNPPDSTAYTGRTISERSVTRGTVSIVDSSNMVSSHLIVRDGDHWRVTSITDTLTTTRDGQVQNDALTALYPGVEFVQVLDSAGTAINMTGFEEILRRADSALPEATAKNLRQTMNPQFLSRREISEWNGRIGRFAGKTMTVGETIYDTSGVPLPGAGAVTYYRAVKLAEAPMIDGKQCAVFRVSAFTDPSKLAEHLQMPVDDVYKQFGIDASVQEKLAANQVSSSLISEWTLEVATMLLRGETIERHVSVAVGGTEMSTSERRIKEFIYK